MRLFKGVLGSMLAVSVAAVAVAWGAAGPPQGAQAQPAPSASPTIHYVPIASSVFVPRAVVKRWAQRQNVPATMRHAAQLWSGLTAPSGEILRGTNLAVFDTWYTPCEIYPHNATDACGGGIIIDPNQFNVPRQFLHAQGLDPGEVFSSVRYNAEMRSFALSPYPASSSTATYASGIGLQNALNAGLTNLNDTVSTHAMMVKPVYETLSATRPTLIQVWSGPELNEPASATTSPNTPGSDTWKKFVLVDPTGHATNGKAYSVCANVYDIVGNLTGTSTVAVPAGSYKVVPLSDFYSIPLTSAEQVRVRSLQQRFRALRFQRRAMLGATASPSPAPSPCATVNKVNPVRALVAMHVSSAELPQVWTWQTFWYQPDRTTGLPGSQGPFRHFDTATAYWTTNALPVSFRYAFNPYLEAGFGTGTFNTPSFGGVTNLGKTTNCISCHSQATWIVNAQATTQPGYVAHGDQQQLKIPQTIKTLNLWSMAGRAGHPSPAPSPSP